MTLEHNYFQARLTYDPRREVLWRTLYSHQFSHLILETDCVLELGAGYGHFINQVKARRRIAVDHWDGFINYLQPGVEGRVGDVVDLSFLTPSSVNFVFASNLFEHLSQSDFATVLCQLKNVLAIDGTINIVQPNYYYAYREYFDDYTHHSIYTHTSICDFLEANGFYVIECQPRYLPMTTKSSLSIWPWLIRLYLDLPWKPLGKQMFIRARPKENAKRK